MATEDIVGGLFGINPDMYRQQQQQQVFNRAVALQNLNPFQQAAVGYQQAGYNLAGALGGAMGGVDPQLQRISALNAISKQIDQSNPESMMSGAKMLADAGFTQEALGLAQYARKANSEIALAQQRQREGAVASTDAIKNAIALADASGFAKGTLEYSRAYKDALASLTAKPEKADATTNEIKNATAVADLSGFAKGTLEYNNAFKVELARLTAKPTPPTKDKKVSEFAQLLQDAGLDPESEEYKNQVKEFAKLKLTKPEKVEPTTNEAKNAAIFADASGFAKGTPEYEKVFSDKFAELISKAGKAERAPPSVGGDREAISLDKFDKNYYDLTQAQRAVVNAIIDAKPTGGVTVTNVMPGDKALVDVPAFRRTVQGTIDSQLKVVDATDTALVNIDDSIKTNNFASYRAAQVQFAKAIAGAGDLSTKELLAAGADPSLLGGTADYFSRLFSSTPTLDTQNNIRKTLLAIRKVAVDKAQNEITQQRKIAEQSNYPKAALDTALNFPQLKPYQGGAKASKTLTTKSGKTVTVTEE